MKLNEALNCLAALNALDGHQKIVKDGGVEKPVFVAYKFSVNVRMTIARNMAKLNAEQKAYQEARNGFIRELSGGGEKVPEDKLPEFRKYDAAILEGECEDLKLTKLTMEDLNLGTNEELPNSVVAALLPLLDDEPAA